MKTPLAILALALTPVLTFPQNRSVRDDLGRTVSCPAPPRRIVSLAPSITETLFALNLDSAVVGVTDFCDYPPAAVRKHRVGGITNPNLEEITSLRPDLVVMTVSGNAQSDFDKLTSLGMKVFVSDPKTVDDIFRSIRDLGTLCGRDSIAGAMVDSLQERERQLIRTAAALPRKSVLLLLSLRPLIAVGNGTFIDELLTLANAANVTHDTPTAYPLLSREEIIRLQPDVLIGTKEIAHSTADLLTEYPEWNTLAALRDGHVALIDADLISRPGPRIIEGLDQLVRAIHGK